MTMPTSHTRAPESTPVDTPRSIDVLIVETDGTSRLQSWTPTADGGLLDQLQGAVGGLVDVVALTDQLDMWVHDEGLYVCEPNPVATLLALAHGRRSPFYGPAVFTGGADASGDTCGLDPRSLAGLQAAAELARADATRLAAVTVDAVAFAFAYR